MKKILFVCVENAGRSQMAEAFAKKCGKDKFIVSSAGNKPAEKISIEANKIKPTAIASAKTAKAISVFRIS